MYVRFNAYLATRDWDAMAEMIADDVCDDDRRRVVSGGIQRGRDAQIANLRAVVDVGVKNIELVVIATRGERLALTRARVSGGDQQDEAFGLEMLSIIEIDTDDRFAAAISFDLDDMEAAFAELDARYLAGEAAAHAHTWSLVAQAYAAFNRHEHSRTSPDWVNIDHRRGIASAPGDMLANVGALWEVAPDISTHIEAVHRLSSQGAIFTHTESGTSPEGFEAEWRTVALLAIQGDAIKRCELFDEADLDAALTQGSTNSAHPRRQLENAATRTWALLADAFNRRDVDAFVELTSPDGTFDDRRKGLRDSQDASMRRRVTQTLFEYPLSWRMDLEHVAIRGSKLSLSRQTLRDSDEAGQPITLEVLVLTECSDDNLARNVVLFDPDDIDDAMAELTARWIASGQELSQKT